MPQRMRVITAATVAAGLAAASLAFAKEKKKAVLPDYVLWAQTAFVEIDPDAGTPVNDPTGNRTAREDVERALMKWGRLRLTMDEAHADVLIVIRKGTKQTGQPTVGGDPNDRPVIVEQTDGAIRIGGQRGQPVDVTKPGKPEGPAVGAETGPSDDMFSVYRGQGDAPLQSAPLWRYMAAGALRSPDVPAVKEFKKAVDEAVKQQQQQQKQKQQQQAQGTKP